MGIISICKGGKFISKVSGKVFSLSILPKGMKHRATFLEGFSGIHDGEMLVVV
jgi:hypothetical protein